MENPLPLHSSIIAMVSLAASIAAKHPSLGICQLARLREMGVSEDQLQTVIELARHIRDEAAVKFDAAFDAEAGMSVGKEAALEPVDTPTVCCSPNPDSRSCC